MQDITEHIKELHKYKNNITVLESYDFSEIYLGESKDIKSLMKRRYSSEVNESGLSFDEMLTKDPNTRRKAALKMLKDLYIKIGTPSEDVLNDMGLWNVSKYVKWILKTEFKGSNKAEETMKPLFKLVEDLKDYGDDHINLINTAFRKSGTVDKSLALSLVKDDNIEKWVMSLDSGDFVIPSIMVYDDIISKFNLDTNKLEKYLKSLKKNYTEFELHNMKDGSYIISGRSKNYDKELRKLEKALTKRILSDNK